jgi:hypothetical protein
VDHDGEREDKAVALVARFGGDRNAVTHEKARSRRPTLLRGLNHRRRDVEPRVASHERYEPRRQPTDAATEFKYIEVVPRDLANALFTVAGDSAQDHRGIVSGLMIPSPRIIPADMRGDEEIAKGGTGTSLPLVPHALSLVPCVLVIIGHSGAFPNLTNSRAA